jgi:hypothetical protein
VLSFLQARSHWVLFAALKFLFLADFKGLYGEGQRLVLSCIAASCATLSVTLFLDIFICPRTHVIVLLCADFFALTASRLLVSLL